MRAERRQKVTDETLEFIEGFGDVGAVSRRVDADDLPLRRKPLGEGPKAIGVTAGVRQTQQPQLIAVLQNFDG